MNKPKKIDIHAHATPWPEISPIDVDRGIRWISADELIKNYDRLNIEKGVLLPLTSSECFDQVITTGDCKYVAEQYPDRFLWFCGLDPRMAGYKENADFSRLIENYKKFGAKGVGELVAQLPMTHPLMDNLFYHCAECDMPVTIHIATRIGNTYGILDDMGLPGLEKMMKKHKKLKILGHSQSFWCEISGDLTKEQRGGYPTGKVTDGRIAQLMRECENLYCDISAGSGYNALSRDPEYAARFIEEFSDRILYGCDYCFNGTDEGDLMEGFLDKMLADKMISEENYYKLVRGNAIKVLKLDEK